MDLNRSKADSKLLLLDGTPSHQAMATFIRYEDPRDTARCHPLKWVYESSFQFC
ncbi:hypothetical protein HBI23_056090 [Parastagonospora nodorum]|nr:hypothetical protein HBI79_074120 [Parastagonospora nodorum]KAH5337802.1 hypothetical protein HBI12_014420 [Parastagonospora nodorum]KAH5678243.1 hypothetical protein HBI23_056090 [Parastagonospora nodorum]KAH6060560.1 hypothetical protein HBI66_197100 [Parastagonospora nodorum]KAH6063305.1 hypothetical protein HBI67_138430 [Parastagonospora nodorum]